ncbi:MAG: tRNA wybutosine-synthesizing protein 1 [Thermoproteota archaeon]|nr:tRNA wybutosine-synthesizing protein 1 [Thermoproteota archaeon]
MTPSVAHCTLRCRFCWRVQSEDIHLPFNETAMDAWDDPSSIVEGAIEAQKRILSGYKAHALVSSERYSEAIEPKHAAISLAGEPALYPDLNGLVREFHSRDFTTFIVTNGTVPERIEKLEREPTQFYVSVCASSEASFLKVCKPQIAGAWQKLNKTLDLLSSLSCPTVMRLTLARDVNLSDAEGYAKLIEKANPTYVEPKAYVYVGMSRLRLRFENMPTHKEIREFGERLCTLTGYQMIDESKSSRVVLLSRLKKAIRLI